jgi:Na+-driven multidrug efflux pump
MPDVGTIARALTLTALSNMGASLALVVRNLLDSYYAARVSTESLAALTMTVPVTALMIGLSQGISISSGNAVAMAQRDSNGIGAASQRVPATIAVALLCGTAVACVLFMLAQCGLLLIDNNAIRRATALTRWLAIGAPLLFLFGTLMSVLRALDLAAISARATMTGLGVGGVAHATVDVPCRSLRRYDR